MTKIYNTLKLVAFVIILFTGKLNAQCTNVNEYETFTVNGPVPAYDLLDYCTWGEEYNTFIANYPGVYTFSVENYGASPIYLTLNDATNVTSVASGGSPLTYTITTPGTYYLHVTESGPPLCTTNQNCHETYLGVSTIPGSPTLVTQPISTVTCVGNNAQFMASALPSNCTYQWQVDDGTGFVNIANSTMYAGVTSTNLIITGVTANMNLYQYRCFITNPVAGMNTMAAVLYVTNDGTLPFAEGFNASMDMPVSWYVADYSWYVETDHGTNNTNGMTVNLYGSSSVYADVITDRIGPITASTSVSFDYRIVDYSSYPGTATPTLDLANDSLNVYVSNDCGTTYTLLASINAANHNSSLNFVNNVYSLAAYAGSNLSFRFKGVKDPSTSADYFLDVDNINIYNITAIDGGVSAITSPSIGGCYTNMEPVVVTITNFGTGPIFAVPVNVYVSGPISQTISSMYTPAIPVGASATYTVGMVDMSFGGVYTFTSSTTLTSDGNSLNDIHVITRTVSPLASVVGQDAICIGNSATLTVNGTADTYTWSTNVNTETIVITPTATTVYTVTGTDSFGCMASGALTLTVVNPTISAINGSACGALPNGTLGVNAFAQGIINWYASPTSTTSLFTGGTFTVNSATTATYYAEATSTANDGLFTTLDAGNGFAGNMFDVNALNSVTVNAVDMHFDSPGTTTVEVWYRPGTYVGFETSNAGWTIVHSTTVSSSGFGVLTPVPGTFAISIPAGQTYGIYVTSVNGYPQTNYTDGTGVGNLYAANSDIEIFEGNGGDYFDVINDPRVFNGKLHYSKEGCASPKIPVVYSVTPNATVTAAATATSVCEGESITIVASGANSYTWSPGGQTTSTIVLYPSATLNSYSVIGAINSCTASASGSLGVKALPVLMVSASSETICAGNSATLSVTGAATYSWSEGTQNESSIVVSPTISTVYTLTAENNEGCVGDTTYNLNVVICTGIGKNTIIDANTFVYPNPNTGFINVVVDNSITSACTLQIFDVAGKEVYNTTLKGNTTGVDIKNLANGLYTYKVVNPDSKSVIKNGKLIKE